MNVAALELCCKESAKDKIPILPNHHFHQKHKLLLNHAIDKNIPTLKSNITKVGITSQGPSRNEGSSGSGVAICGSGGTGNNTACMKSIHIHWRQVRNVT